MKSQQLKKKRTTWGNSSDACVFAVAGTPLHPGATHSALTEQCAVGVIVLFLIRCLLPGYYVMRFGKTPESYIGYGTGLKQPVYVQVRPSAAMML